MINLSSLLKTNKKIMILLIITGCVSSELRISEFNFQYKNKNYIIRSAYCPGNPESCNQILGDSLLAIDFDQDRIIDQVSLGGITIHEAQKIYDYCLNVLEKENKLSKINSSNSTYSISETKYDFEVKTFHPGVGSPLNEFIITDTWNKIGFTNYCIFIDENSNGNLDKVLKGEMSLGEAQTHYDRVLAKGLSTNDLKKTEKSIQVR